MSRCGFPAAPNPFPSERWVRVPGDVWEEGKRVRFTVTDTGIGMTPEQLGKLFEAFVQADAATSRKYGGTGLGLVLSRRFCRLLGGDLAATSEPGVGSTFVATVLAEYPGTPSGPNP